MTAADCREGLKYEEEEREEDEEELRAKPRLPPQVDQNVMDELLRWGGGGLGRGDTMWWGEKGQNIWPESTNVEQQTTNPLSCST